MSIIYRTYQKGDEKGLAETFNLAFQSLGGGFLRTPRLINWRYCQRPHFQPEEIQIAEVKETGEIVGAVYSTIENYYFAGRYRKICAINDVGVKPSFAGKGIARTLMNQALSFMEREQCEFSVLSADPKGFPRKKLYLPMGWKDVCPMKASFVLTNPLSLLKYLSVTLPLLPAIASSDMILKMKTRIFKHSLSSLPLEKAISHPHSKNFLSVAYDFLPLLNNTLPKYFEGEIHYDRDEWELFRISVPIPSLKPTFLMYLYEDVPIVGLSYVVSWIYMSRFGLHAPIAFVKDIVYDFSSFSHLTKNQLTLPKQKRIFGMLMENLILDALLSSHKRNVVGFVAIFNALNGFLNSLFSRLGFFSFSSGTFMIRSNTKPLESFSFRPSRIRIPPGEYAGYP